MSAEDLINECYQEIKPYPYSRIWELYSGSKYSELPSEIKTQWRHAVLEYAEYSRPLPPKEMFNKNLIKQ